MPNKQSDQTVSIIGLGYVGLPLALLARSRGWLVTGIDIDEERVALINQKQLPFADDHLAAQLAQHPITATTDFANVSTADVVIVAVPTPVTTDNQPDLTPLRSALASLRPHLRPGQTLIIESTINPGVMDEVVVPLLQERPDLPLDATTNGTTETLYVCHCPERINPGDPKWHVGNIPRVLGGYSQAGSRRAHQFYESVLDAHVKIMNSPTEAEAVKILENTFRDINIAYINEMARSFDALGIDIVNVIAGAATKPFAFMPHYPGNGVGGHCISVDPYYMIERAKQVGFDHQFLKLARAINDGMPAYTITVLQQALTEHDIRIEDATIAVLGVAYKKDVSDTRNSPAFTIIELLQTRAATLQIYDRFVPAHSTVESLDAALTGATAIMLACDHTELVQQLTPQLIAQHNISVVIDGKNALDKQAFTEARITYHGIGR